MRLTSRSFENTVRIDLHLHSTASDGSLSPAALVHAACEGGLDVIALTDHDTTGGLAEAAVAAAAAVHVIPGLEVSALHEGADVHVLGYFIDAAHPVLDGYVNRALEARRDRMRAMLVRLENIGVSIGFAEVEAAAGPDVRSMGRPHLARALMQRGYVSSFADAFDRYIGDAGPAYLPTDLVNVVQAIEMIQLAGGLAVWAHPRPDVFDREIRRFAAHGLDGVECFRPRCDGADSIRFERTAKNLGLVVTGGSDWHGPWHGKLGGFAVSADEVAGFLERGGM